MRITQSTTQSRHTIGATLVEVVITVGLLATMLLPLVSMLSMAIENSGKATNDTVSSRIATQLVGELQQADWKNIQKWQDATLYYDDQGVRLDEAAGNAEAKSAYTAMVRLDAPNAGITVNSATASSTANPNTRKALVLVSSVAGARGRTLLNEATTAISAQNELPKNVYVSRTILVKLEKGI